ncbi:histidine--tRNA ligase [Anoxynatronum buryatiense]|uniref:Histidine--tRNA ligase n=1 Tax=Anoxynatronum buryatiense TaxID=489973 RepID=A0AA46AIZ3_9CLOT|nr:histidine--tRNA ligase [Anoxynatronum buryatiense]SMP54776.1 histidyl-tRNA synthetase [Anoxynatronum buryatiense]
MSEKQNIVKPSTLPGFMELLPAEQIRFNRMMDTIRRVYERYGFAPLDTPVIEKSEVLLAKGGGETEKQVYRFMKGDSDLSMRFDLTVPLARYVAQHMGDLTFPFRRYQIGKVYRGERNQKGRFREFYQCDIDVIGREKLSIATDAEIPAIIYNVFTEIGLPPFVIRINNRRLMNGLFAHYGVAGKPEMLRAIDKLEKIGPEKTRKELEEAGIDATAISGVFDFIAIEGTNSEKLAALNDLGIDNEQFREGLKELNTVVTLIRAFGVPEESFAIELKIVRGLDYYTGTVYETLLQDYPEIGSVCSGGRYDNLAEYYTKEKLPGVGISIGLTRLFYQLNEAGILGEENISSLSQALVVPIGDTLETCARVASRLRNAGVVTEVYLEEAKIAKKMNYANKHGIPYVVLIGDEEVADGLLTLKNMADGEQQRLSFEDAAAIIKQ